MRFYARLLPLLFFVLTASQSFSQSCFSTGINGTVINLPCNVSCTTMKFQIPHLKSSSDYNVVSIPFNPSLPFTSASSTEVTSVYTDDKFSTTYTLPFPFCFYDTTFTQFVVGSNGVVTFDLINSNCSNAWLLETSNGSGVPVPIPYLGTQTCSNATGPKYPAYSIMSPYHDINPSVTSTSPNRKIEWRVEGTAPCRKLIVTFYAIPLFGQTSKLNTSQIIMHESTGLIDVFIKEKTLDTDASVWNGNRAILGVQKK